MNIIIFVADVFHRHVLGQSVLARVRHWAQRAHVAMPAAHEPMAPQRSIRCVGAVACRASELRGDQQLGRSVCKEQKEKNVTSVGGASESDKTGEWHVS